MKVTEHLERATKPLISYEIIPPLRGGNVQDLLGLIEDLAPYEPPFIDTTSHGAEVSYEETASGIERKVKRKRPGTLGVCALIQNKYNIDAVPHVLCLGFTREETEDFLIELNYLGIDNVLAIRGDENGFRKPLQYGRSANEYASDLVKQIADMNRGKYIEESLVDAEASDYCIGVAGYPEKHFEAPNMETDLRYTKAKVDAGGDYIVTQMFFDNQYYFDYVEACRRIGIEVPIIPGIKILTTKNQLKSIPKKFFCEIPSDLADEAEAAKPEQVLEVGVEWARRQAEDLLNRGVPSLHFYLMQSSKAVTMLMDRLKP
ncbi:MAG: methylenetetrahydrofolate reductase [NAD(P)H] [Acidobacteria bacterium]|nr:MAG: methylenetetrahydrofolate reductase [NAD(P)H] [Acidobacteriota bacterium]